MKDEPDKTLPPSTPVLIGAGQFMEKGKSPSVSLPPMGIAAAAGQRALDDTGAPKQVAAALDALVSVRIFPDSWNRPRDPNPFG
ncbi:MAG TPA: hypothetical protein DCR45_07910, partial [Gammaproteobacteria bacterium]|nr:hypothetical protein [Gammaproteobacteria bacterium]